jgi:succinoglycan biosynthesis transport protein ExoP
MILAVAGVRATVRGRHSGPEHSPMAQSVRRQPGRRSERDETRGSELREYLRIFDRRKWIILVTFALIVSGGVAWTHFQTPVYEARISVLIKERQYGRGTPLEEAAALGRVEAPVNIATEIQIMRSPGLAAKAAEHFEEAATPRLVQTVDIRVPKGTNIAEISATSPEPQAARDYVQALAQAYRDYTLERNQAEAERARSFVEGRIAVVGRQLQEAEDRLEEFRSQHGIAAANEATTQLTARIEALAEQHRRAGAEVAALSAQRKALSSRLAEEPSETVTETVGANPALVQLQQERIELENSRAELLATHEPTSRRVAQIDRQIEAIDERIAEEEDREVTEEVRATNPVHQDLTRELATTASAVDAAAAREQALGGTLREEEARLAQMPAIEVELARLQREVQAQEGTYSTLLATLEDLKIAEASKLPSADLISSEVPTPTEPIRPQPRRNLLVSIGLGILLGLLTALLTEYVDDKFRTLEAIEEETGLPLLGGLPRVEGQARPIVPALAESTTSPISQAADSIWANVQFCGVDEAVRVILVTSPGVGEGKTTLAANLAIAAAKSGNSVIIVDGDLRRPVLHRALGVDSSRGLTNALAGGMSLDGVLQATEVENLRVLAAGPVPPNPVELLSSDSMQRLLEELRGLANVVIVDTPPLLVVPDAQILSRRTDGVVLLVRIGRTSRDALKRAVEMVDRAGGRVLGTTANWVTRRAQQYYYYYYYSDYYSQRTDQERQSEAAAR